MMRRALCKTRVSVCFAALFGCALPTLACSGGEQSAGPGHASDAGPGADGSALSISSLAAVETPNNVLAFDVSWSSSLAADTALDVACNGLEPWTISDPTPTTKHHVFLMGLATGRACTLTAGSSAGKASASEKTTIDVGDLPDFLPQVELSVPPTQQAAGGWTLVNLSNTRLGIQYTVALLDEQGRYRWYYQFPSIYSGSDTPVIPYEDGVVFGGDELPMAYVTWQGELVWQGAYGNHEVRPAETPGDFYYITDSNCDSLTNGTSAVAEYSSAAVHRIWLWKLCDHYTPPQDVPDWSHMNTVALFPDPTFLIASSRNQNSIFKIKRATGDLIWVMGYHGEVEDGFHGDFTIPDTDRFYHQHDTTVLPNGHILMFDNGRAGVRKWSRALELAYTYDPSGTSEAHAVWQFRHDPDIFARIWGGTQRLDNGNTLVCFGSIDLGTQTTISEVSSASKPVWEVRMPPYWGVYRARRMTTRPRGAVIL